MIFRPDLAQGCPRARGGGWFKELWLQLHGNPFRPYDVWRIELADVEPLKAPA